MNCRKCNKQLSAKNLKSRHRLLIDDCTAKENVERLMAGERAAVTITDPPYGLGDTQSDKNNYESYDDTRENLTRTIGGFLPLAQTHSDVVLVTPGNGNQSLYPPATWTLAWFTPAGVGRGPWGFCCWQPILCYGKDPKLANGLGCHPDALVHTESSEDFGHPCAKPIGFWSWLMERVSSVGESVYDPFMGSGTTFVAAEKTGRIAYGCELDPVYGDVILTRFAKFTGKEPVREDGVKWSELNG